MTPEMMAYLVRQMTPAELRHTLALQRARTETDPRTGEQAHYCRGCGQRVPEPPRRSALRRVA